MPTFSSTRRAELLAWGNNSIPIMRDRVINVVKDAPELSEEKSKSLETFVRSAPESVIREIYARMISVTEAAETLSWTAKLKDYIKTSPPKYEEYKGVIKPLDFLENTWGVYMDHGVLYQDELTDYDEKIIHAIYNYWNGHARQAGDRLPLPRRDRTEAILQRVVAQGPDSLEDVMKAIRAYARRGDRAR